MQSTDNINGAIHAYQQLKRGSEPGQKHLFWF